MTGNLQERLKRAWPELRDGYDRADVERRGRRLIRRRAAAVVLSSGALVLALLVSVGLVLGDLRLGRDGSPAASPPARKVFAPPTRPEGGKTVLPVTFPDGTTAEVTYPASLMIAELGAYPQGGFGTLEGPEFSGCCTRDFVFEYVDPNHRGFMAADPIKEFPGAGGRTVRLVPAPPNGLSDYLVFDIGAWRVGVWSSSLTDQQMATWSRTLQVRVGADGFPLLAATQPLKLSAAGEGGPFLGLTFGAADGERQVSMQLRACDAPLSRKESDRRVVMCKPEWSMWLTVSGDDQFVADVVAGVEIRNVQPARR